MEKLILGIDEAGRGPVIGPLVFCGCLIGHETEKELRKIGIKDSKDLTQRRREFFEEKIKSLAKNYRVMVCAPNDIDKNHEAGDKLNELEGDFMAKIINSLNDKKARIKVVVDCPSVSILKWTDYLKTKVRNLSNLEFVVEHKADRNHIAVSAASILAKCERERQIDKLKKIYGDEVGSGYPSDPLTIRFLEKNALKLKDKGIFRKSWKTYEVAIKKISQERLF